MATGELYVECRRHPNECAAPGVGLLAVTGHQCAQRRLIDQHPRPRRGVAQRPDVAHSRRGERPSPQRGVGAQGCWWLLMAKKPNIPCASGCGKLLWPGRTTLPVGVAACRSCWRPASRDTAKAARDAPLQHLRGHVLSAHQMCPFTSDCAAWCAGDAAANTSAPAAPSAAAIGVADEDKPTRCSHVNVRCSPPTLAGDPLPFARR